MNTPPSDDVEVRRLDQLCERYLTALDADDWPTLAGLWHQAEVDAALKDALHEVDWALVVEAELEHLAPGSPGA